jgi:hypothetical protein
MPGLEENWKHGDFNLYKNYTRQTRLQPSGDWKIECVLPFREIKLKWGQPSLFESVNSLTSVNKWVDILTEYQQYSKISQDLRRAWQV